MRSSSAKTPKLQLAAEKPSTGECRIPAKKDTPHPRVKEKPQQDDRRVKSHLESNPISARDARRAQTKPYVHQDPETPETEPELCLSVSCRSTGQQWPATGAGALGAGDLGQKACGISLLEEVTINPP